MGKQVIFCTIAYILFIALLVLTIYLIGPSNISNNIAYIFGALVALASTMYTLYILVLFGDRQDGKENNE